MTRVVPSPLRAGFTLVEMTIVVAIIAIVAAVAIPAIGNISMAELRGSASKLSGVIRSTYDQAALSGQTLRMTLDFESKAIRVASTDQVLNLEPEANVLAEASKVHQAVGEISALAETLAAEMELGDDEAPMVPINAFLGVNKLAGSGATGESTFGEEATALTLDESVHVLDVWVEGMGEATSQGQAYLYFFPHGYTQDALIHLEDEDGRVFTVKVHALTGKTSIEAEYVEPPK